MDESHTVYKVPLRDVEVHDGPSNVDLRKRYYKCGVFTYSMRSNIVGIEVKYKSLFEDKMDNWPYTICLMVGDVAEWGTNPYLDIMRVCS